MVCIRKLHPLRDALPYYLTKKLLPAAALPNLVAAAAAAAAAPGGSAGAQQQQPGQGKAAAGVPEVVLWGSGSIQKAAAEAEKLLLDPQARAEQVGGQLLVVVCTCAGFSSSNPCQAARMGRGGWSGTAPNMDAHDIVMTCSLKQQEHDTHHVLLVMGLCCHVARAICAPCQPHMCTWLACMLLQVEHLKQVVRGLLPPQPPAPTGQTPAPLTPSDAAAKVLLQLIHQARQDP